MALLMWTKSAPRGSTTHQQEDQVSSSANKDLVTQTGHHVTDQLPHKSLNHHCSKTWWSLLPVVSAYQERSVGFYYNSTRGLQIGP
uniref:Uncharacterized protein n=1 Tax=Cannabis sativa TaxID=3483 RepID=A0A803PRD5_CANSA